MTQSNVVPMPTASPSPRDMWPIVPDAPDLRAIVEDQADTIQAQEALLHAYQTNLNSAQNPPSPTAVTGQGTTTGLSSTVAITAATGAIPNGSTVAGTGVPTNPVPTVLGFISGASPNGNYLLSAAVNLATATTLTFTPPPPASTWPSANDSDTLLSIQQIQTAVLRVQSALLQHYVDLLNTSAVPQPPTGP